jgi:hypothetical protein
MNSQYLFPITPELTEYNSLRLKYKNLATAAYNNYLKNFTSIFVNADGLHEKGDEIAVEYIKNSMSVAIEDLIQYKINDIDEEFFFSNFLGKYTTWDDDFSKVDGKYLEIVSSAEELDQYRTARREGRGRVIGGGFGLSGFAKGAATAGLVNLGTNVVHGTWNAGAKVFSAIGDAMKKQSLFDDLANRQLLAESIERIVFCTHLAVIDAIKSKKSKAFSGRITVADEEKSNRLLQNVSKGRIKNDEIEDILLESLNCNPYNEESYLTLLDKKGDASGGIERTATYFGLLSVENAKKVALDTYKASLDTSTASACYENLKILKDKSLQLGYQKFDAYEKEVVALAQSLDLQHRTVEGKVFPTIEDAQKERDKLQKAEIVSNNTYQASTSDVGKIF